MKAIINEVKPSPLTFPRLMWMDNRRVVILALKEVGIGTYEGFILRSDNAKEIGVYDEEWRLGCEPFNGKITLSND